jgi:hypothetical protein
MTPERKSALFSTIVFGVALLVHHHRVGSFLGGGDFNMVLGLIEVAGFIASVWTLLT